ncbi:MAG: 30S ribosome-binding factor RbfA [Alphaproteobacteria bacterium]|nr:30S ribosome-binding factor RbfA [Alphaproteobacteria bacterium]
MRSQRQLKVGETLRHALAQLFQRGDVPWPASFKPPIVTISQVQVSPDLRAATAFFSTMGEGADAESTFKALKELTGFFRHAMGRAVNLRYVPTLVFKLDTSFNYAQHIDEILSMPAVAKDLAKKDGEK